MKICPICGESNNDGTQFCESCGNPLEESQSEEQRTPALEIAVGYASSRPQESGKNDTFFVVDAATLFEGVKHHRVLCVMVKGLAGALDGRALTQDLLADILQSQGEIDYSLRLLEIQNKMKTDFGGGFLDEAADKSETRLLVGVVCDAQVNVLRIGVSGVFVSRSESGEIAKIDSDDGLVSFNLKSGDFVCMSFGDLGIVGESEVMEAISKSETPQKACEKLASRGKTADAERSFSLMMVRAKA